MLRPVLLGFLFTVASALSVAGQPVVAGQGQTMPSAVRLGAGAITTLYVTGLNTMLSGAQSASSIPLPTSIAGISVNVVTGTQTYQAPLFAVQQTTICTDQAQTPDCTVTAVTIQVPFEIGNLAGTTAGVNVAENGSVSRTFKATLLADDVHVLTSCDTLAGGGHPTTGTCQPQVTHADGTAVSASSPLHAGETAVIYATGLGQTNPPVATGVASPNPPAIVGSVLPSFNQFAAQLEFYPNAGPSKLYTLGPGPISSGLPFVGLVPGYVGLYQINVPVAGPPLGTPPCLGGVMSNLTINVGSKTSFDGAPVCVAIQNE